MKHQMSWQNSIRFAKRVFHIGYDDENQKTISKFSMLLFHAPIVGLSRMPFDPVIVVGEKFIWFVNRDMIMNANVFDITEPFSDLPAILCIECKISGESRAFIELFKIKFSMGERRSVHD